MIRATIGARQLQQRKTRVRMVKKNPRTVPLRPNLNHFSKKTLLRLKLNLSFFDRDNAHLVSPHSILFVYCVFTRIKSALKRSFWSFLCVRGARLVKSSALTLSANLSSDEVLVVLTVSAQPTPLSLMYLSMGIVLNRLSSRQCKGSAEPDADRQR